MKNQTTRISGSDLCLISETDRLSEGLLEFLNFLETEIATGELVLNYLELHQLVYSLRSLTSILRESHGIVSEWKSQSTVQKSYSEGWLQVNMKLIELAKYSPTKVSNQRKKGAQ